MSRNNRSYTALRYVGFPEAKARQIVTDAQRGDSDALRLAKNALYIMRDVWGTP